MIKKYFALSVLTTSMLVAAGCSSSDDDDDTPAATTGETGGTTGETTGETGGTTGETGGVTGETGGTTGETGETTGETGGEPVTDTTTFDGSSILDAARGTSADEGATFTGGNPELSSLVTALENFPELLNLLDDETATLTVFAPNNAAFAAAAETLAGADEATIENVLRYHVVVDTDVNVDALSEEEMTALTSEEGIELTASNGATLTLSQDEASMIVVNDGEATVVASDSSPSNGTVHIIDTVLDAPPAVGGTDGETGGTTGETGGEETGGATTGGGAGAEGSTFAAIQSDGNLSSFLGLVESSNYSLNLQDPENNEFVVFAPTNATFGTLTASNVVNFINVRADGTEGPAAPGSYTGNGEGALTFDLAGEGESLTVNGLPATYVETSSGGALYTYGE